jgi:peptidoglycan LD-endopeptidase LytH
VWDRRPAGLFMAGVVSGLLAGLVALTWSLAARTPRAAAGRPPSRETGASPPAALAADYERLRARRLLLPLADLDASSLQDSFRDSRSGHVHEAIDILAPQGTPVRAVDDGVIRRLMNSDRGGLTIYQVDPTGTFAYVYAHLSRYAAFITEGKTVRRGEVLGSVGHTGNASASAPHLHLAILKLRDPERWWDGTALNPYQVFAR